VIAIGRRAVTGVGAIETLLALPALLLAGLATVQLALLYRAQHALNHAVFEAARAGSLTHASPERSRDGLARGLAPWLYGAATLQEHAGALVRARAHVAEGEAAGWLRIEQQSPTAASFADWAEPALDAAGLPMPELREIPNDGLVHRARRGRPSGDVAGLRGEEAIGAASGQTLADANLLRLRLQYGVPLVVPFAGRLIAATLRAWNGCEPGTATRAGLLVLPAAEPLASPQWQACAFYGDGRLGTLRVPVSASATVRMQSPARMSWATPEGAPPYAPTTAPASAPSQAPHSPEPDPTATGPRGSQRPSPTPPAAGLPQAPPGAGPSRSGPLVASVPVDPAVCAAVLR
jgi:hypothetical protein